MYLVFTDKSAGFRLVNTSASESLISESHLESGELKPFVALSNPSLPFKFSNFKPRYSTPLVDLLERLYSR